MKEPQDIILYPVLTEKALRLKEKENKYTFYVARDANKTMVKKAIEELFKVKVKKVNIMNLRGKPRRIGRFFGRRPHRKKAICQLEAGHKIEIFEGM